LIGYNFMNAIFIYNIPRDRYIAGNFFEQSSHTSVCSKKITRGRQPEGNFERQTRVLDCKKKFLAICVPELADQIYSAFSLVITESNSV
jgi:hypothetical protein